MAETEEELKPDGVDALAIPTSLAELEGSTQGIHVVLLGDSTLDNGRYLNYDCGELSVQRQLSTRFARMGWGMTWLAQDGSLIEDVLVRQVPHIPDVLSDVSILVKVNFELRLNVLAASWPPEHPRFAKEDKFASLCGRLVCALLQATPRLACWVCFVLRRERHGQGQRSGSFANRSPALERATHIVVSVSGNDLLALLNEMVQANFTAASMYRAIVTGLGQVADRYRSLIQKLASSNRHLACCTVYRPNFSHVFFKTLATFSLGIHNSRLQQISVDLDCSMIDLANMFDCKQDFANPLELSTQGGSKFVQSIMEFVADHAPVAASVYRTRGQPRQAEVAESVVGMLTAPLVCCATNVSQRKVYCSKKVSKIVEQPSHTSLGSFFGRPLRFSDEQEQWRQT